MNVENEMVNQISHLGEENSFAYVDLKLTPKRLDLIDQLSERVSVQYDRFGDLHLFKEELTTFLKKHWK